jgi:hypothetical protein
MVVGVLGRLDPAGLREHFRRDLVVAADRPAAGRGGELAAIERDHPDRDESGIGAEQEHLAE